ncbi:tetratricopeptide repeat protein [bacterium]|nr:tetratricopeptide repeat protein [bacterium]
MKKPGISRKLIPDFILNRFSAGDFFGGFDAYALSVDISGFTRMTDLLMASGKEGAEILSEKIIMIFGAVIAIIEENGGFISAFAGDSLTAVLGDEDSVKSSCIRIAEYFRTLKKLRIGRSSVELSARVGAAFGEVSWKIISLEDRNTYFFSGSAFSQAYELQGKARLGYYKMRNRSSGSITGKAVPDLRPEVKRRVAREKQFIQNEVLQFKMDGEFRYVISVFISYYPEALDEEKFFFSIEVLCNKLGGFLDKIDHGDKGCIVMVGFGAPRSLEDMQNRALEFIMLLGADFPAIRVGITGGTAFCGYLGGNERCEYTFLGKKVNLAARFMMAADWGEVYVDGQIAEDRNNFSFIAGSEKKFKGFTQSVKPYILQGKSLEGKFEFKGHLIGRKKELAKIRRKIASLSDGSCQGIFYIDGPAGIGKSRIISSIKEYVESKDYEWIEMSCDGILKESFNPFKKFFSSFFGINSDQSEEEKEMKFNQGAERILNTVTDEDLHAEFVRSIPALRAFLDLNTAGTLFEKLDPKRKYENTLLMLKVIIKIFSLAAPLVIDLDDGHWADQSTIDLVKYLFNNIDKYPILVLSGCRAASDGSPFRFGIKNYSESSVELGQLEEEDITELIIDRTVLNPKSEFSELIWQKSEGNPFFAEQMMMYLEENDLVTYSGTSCGLKAAAFDLPGSISSIIIARVDRLNSELKEIVKAASVLGREFSINILSHMLQGRSSPSAVSAIEREAIWAPLNELRYIFKHALIQESIYNMQLKKRLRSLHLLAAQTIEAIGQDNLLTQSPSLAFHYDNALIRQRAIHYYKISGDTAKGLFNNENAMKYYLRALELIGSRDSDAKLDILESLGDIYNLKADYVLSRKYYRRVLRYDISLKSQLQIFRKIAENYQNAGDHRKALSVLSEQQSKFKFTRKTDIRLEKAHILTRMGKSCRLLGKIKEAVKLVKQSASEVEKVVAAADPETENEALGIKAHALIQLGQSNLELGKYDHSIQQFKAAGKLAEKLQDPALESITFNYLGNVYMHWSEFKKASVYYKKFYEFTIKAGDVHGMSVALGNLGNIYSYMKQNDKALEYYKKDLEITKEVDSLIGLASAYANLGSFYESLGQLDEAFEMLEIGLKMARKIGYKRLEAMILSNIGVVRYHEGNFRTAIKFFDSSLKLARQVGNKRQVSSTTNNIGALYNSLDERKKALRYFKEHLQMAKELKDKRAIIRALNNTGIALLALRRHKEALSLYEEAVRLCVETKDEEFLGYCIYKLAECECSLDMYEESYSHFRESIRKLQKGSDTISKIEAHQSYAEAILLNPNYSDENQLKKAWKNLKISRKLAEELDNKHLLASQNHREAMYYYYCCDYCKAAESMGKVIGFYENATAQSQLLSVYSFYIKVLEKLDDSPSRKLLGKLKEKMKSIKVG